MASQPFFRDFHHHGRDQPQTRCGVGKLGGHAGTTLDFTTQSLEHIAGAQAPAMRFGKVKDGESFGDCIIF